MVESQCKMRSIHAQRGQQRMRRIWSAQWIISDDLGYRNVSTRWVPRFLTEDKKANLVVCEKLLTRYETEEDEFLSHIVTYDKIWMHHHIPESKQASRERRKPEEAAPRKTGTRLSAGKVLATFLGIAEAYCSLICSTNGVLHKVANCSMKWNWPIDEKGETWLSEARFCSVTTLGLSQLH